MDGFRCTTSLEGEKRWFIYWISDEEVVGITDGKHDVYETAMDRLKRRKLLGNIAESLLEDTWKEAFEDSTFVVKTLTNNRVSLTYVVDRIMLDSISEDAAERISQILFFAISTLNKLMQKGGFSSRPSASTLSKLRPNKPIPKTENSSVIDPTKRKRNRPTGLQFND